MMKEYRYLHLMLLCSLLASCSQNDLADSAQRTQLEIEASLGNANTRSAILGKQLEENVSIGLSVFDSNREGLYNNIRWDNSNNKLRAAQDIYVTESPYRICAYSPYNKEVSTVESIPLLCNQTDYLWGKSIDDDVSIRNPKATLVFDHVMARLALRVKADEDVPVRSIQIRNKANKAILPDQQANLSFNALTGQINGLSASAMEQIDFGVSEQRISNTTELAVSLIVLPTHFGSGDLEFVFDVNSREVVVPLTTHAGSEGWKQGYSYAYEAVLTRSSASVTNSTFIQWVDVPVIDLDINQEQNYKYSSDKVFLYYNKETLPKRIAYDATFVEFNIYSSQNIPVSAITASYTGNEIISRVDITSKPSPSSVNAGDVRPLGSYIYTVQMVLNPNTNSSSSRLGTCKLMANGSEIGTFSALQLGVDNRALEDVLVDIGGLKWMPFNTSGNLANDVKTAQEIKNAGNIVDYAYSDLSKWYTISGTYFTGVAAVNNTACPGGYRVPTLGDYTTMFGSNIPVRGVGAPSLIENKWLSDNPSSGSLTLPKGVLNAIPRPNLIGVIPIYWIFVSSGKSLYFIGSGSDGVAGSNIISNSILEGMGIWTSSTRSKDNAERVAPWRDGWANNVALISKKTSQVRCVKQNS